MEKVIVIFIVLAMVSGCLTNKEKENIRQDAYEEGYAYAKTEWYANGKREGKRIGREQGLKEGKEIGFTNGHKEGWLKGKIEGLHRGDSIGYIRGYDVGLLDGRKWAFKENVIFTIRSTAPQAAGMGISFFVFLIWFSVPYRLWFPKASKRFVEYFRDQSWKVESKFGKVSRLKVELKRWIKVGLEVTNKLGRLDKLIVHLEERKIKFQEFLCGDISIQSKQQTLKDIQKTDDKIGLINNDRLKAKKILENIDQIKNDLEHQIWKVKNKIENNDYSENWESILMDISRFMNSKFG